MPVLVATLGPQALAVVGRLAAGTTLAWFGLKTVREHIVPVTGDSAAAAARPSPRVLATLPVYVTDEPNTVRASISLGLYMYGKLFSYRAIFERKGVDGSADLALVGSPAEVADGIAELAAAGVTDFASSEYCSFTWQRRQTRVLLKKITTEI